MNTQIIGPRLPPRLHGHQLIPPAEREFQALRAWGCGWREFVAPMARARAEAHIYAELIAQAMPCRVDPVV